MKLPNSYFLLGIVIAGCSAFQVATGPSLPQQGPPVAVPQVPAPSLKKIILIGDSHSDYYGNGIPPSFGFFGYRMQQLVPNLSLIAISSATPSWFLNSHSAPYGCTVSANVFSVSQCKTSPALPASDAYIVELGANMAEWPEAKIAGEVKALVAAFHGKQCWWIGKPPSKNTSTAEELRIERTLQANVSPCKYISSRFFQFEENANLNDHEHLSVAAAKLWAEGITQRLGPFPL